MIYVGTQRCAMMQQLAEPQSYIDDGEGLARESRADWPVCNLPIVSRTLCLPRKAEWK